MKTKREALEVKRDLQARNPGRRYEVCRDGATWNAHSPWYVRRVPRAEKVVR